MAVTNTPLEMSEQCGDFLRSYYKQDVLELAGKYPREQTSIKIDWMDLYRSNPELADDLLDEPDTVLDAFNEALRLFDLPVDIELNDASVRVTNLQQGQTYHVTQTRSEHVNQYLAITGQVQKTSPVVPRLDEAAFECQQCGTITYIPQSGTFQEPHECQGCERTGVFLINTEESVYEDHQLIRVQEPPERTKGGEGEHIDAHLSSDLVASVYPGDRIDMHGILRIKQQGANGSKPKRNMQPYFETKAIEVQETDFEDIEVEDKVDEIRALAKGEEGDPYELLIDSIAPGIWGARDIKEAVSLQLFGGWRHENPDGTIDRGDSHIFLVGDPGSGKSTILRAVEDIAPRAVFSEGKGLTKAGATAAATRDDFGDTEWGLEAGALVLANKGIACIDELDKVDEDAKESLHGALESQRVNINKAGINATLPAQTSLLAAGNPVWGRFDRYEPISEQIDLSPTLISRFDLIFIVTDEPSEGRDREIAEHRIKSRQISGKQYLDEQLSDAEKERIEPAINRELLRAYIAYAKRNVFPIIRDPGVEQDLIDFYTNLRTAGSDENNAVPVTARSLEAILRLAEASARIRLSEEIEHSDVKRATKLVQKTMQEVGIDPETKEYDVDVIETGQSKSQQQRVKTVQQLIHDMDDGEPIPVSDVLDEAEREGFDREKARKSINDMAECGDVYRPKQDAISPV